MIRVNAHVGRESYPPVCFMTCYHDWIICFANARILGFRVLGCIVYIIMLSSTYLTMSWRNLTYPVTLVNENPGESFMNTARSSSISIYHHGLLPPLPCLDPPRLSIKSFSKLLQGVAV